MEWTLRVYPYDFRLIGYAGRYNFSERYVDSCRIYRCVNATHGWQTAWYFPVEEKDRENHDDFSLFQKSMHFSNKSESIKPIKESYISLKKFDTKNKFNIINQMIFIIKYL